MEKKSAKEVNFMISKFAEDSSDSDWESPSDSESSEDEDFGSSPFAIRSSSRCEDLIHSHTSGGKETFDFEDEFSSFGKPKKKIVVRRRKQEEDDESVNSESSSDDSEEDEVMLKRRDDGLMRGEPKQAKKEEKRKKIKSNKQEVEEEEGVEKIEGSHVYHHQEEGRSRSRNENGRHVSTSSLSDDEEEERSNSVMFHQQDDEEKMSSRERGQAIQIEDIYLPTLVSGSDGAGENYYMERDRGGVTSQPIFRLFREDVGGGGYKMRKGTFVLSAQVLINIYQYLWLDGIESGRV